MTAFAINPPVQPSLAIRGSDARFPVRRIFCVGRNYEAHVREMGNEVREMPFFFTKPGHAAVPASGVVPYPPLTQDMHHEIELVVALGKAGRAVCAADVPALLWGAAVGVDLTRRDLQAEAKARGRPWDEAKGFDASAPIGPLVPIAEVPSLTSGRIWLSVNGETRQSGDLSEMIWPVADHVAILSRSFRLEPGDLIMTGTPAGVGPVVPGDRVQGGIDGLPEIDFAIGPQAEIA